MLIDFPATPAMTVRLLLFGSPTIEYGGDSFALPFERRSQLLVFLALKRSWVGRAELAALLWPEQDTKLAYANLRKTVFRLQSVRWSAPIEAQGAALRTEVETEVYDFESALQEQRIADALLLRRGELLAGFDDDGNEAWSSWLNFGRDETHRLARQPSTVWRPLSIPARASRCEGCSGQPLTKARCATRWRGWREDRPRARAVYRDWRAAVGEPG
jgi:hypothetical protein